MDSPQCFLSSMKQPFALVEPYITVQGYTDAPDRMHFRDIFDVEHFNSKSRQSSGVELVTMNEYHQYGPQQIIIVMPGTFKAEVLWPPKKINEERSLCLQREKLLELWQERDVLQDGERQLCGTHYQAAIEEAHFITTTSY